MKQTITRPLSIKSYQEEGFFSGYASVFNVQDHHEDIIIPNAFKKSLEKWKEKGSFPKLLWQHDPRQPIGIWHEITEDAQGLFVKGQLLLDLQQAREAYALLKAGVISEISIGFRPLKTSRKGHKHLKYIEEIELHEISLVTFAANENAKVMTVKKFDVQPFVEQAQQLIKLLKLPTPTPNS